MKTNQKGFSPILIILPLLLVAFIFIIFPRLPKGPPGGKLNQIPKQGGSWKIEEGNTGFMRAAHMAVFNEFNQYGARTLDADYFEYLRDINVNWVGISVALFVDDALDSTVERKTGLDGLRTHTDQELRALIKQLKKHGFHVYVTLALEDEISQNAKYPLRRFELGKYDNRDRPANEWPWHPANLNHNAFVTEFFETYTNQAVHFAKILEEEGVELYSLGTETEGLFRTRPFGDTQDDFRPRLLNLVQSVRAVYSGKLTYDLHYSVFKFFTPEENPSRFIWGDLGLDVIGISAYFGLTDILPKKPIAANTLQTRWEQIFTRDLKPLKDQYPDKDIVFLEFGYPSFVYSIYDGDVPNRSKDNSKEYHDNDKNGFEDGEEQQANAYKALFDTMDKYPGVVKGVFLWEEDFPNKLHDYVDAWGVRDKLAEEVVRKYYEKW